MPYYQGDYYMGDYYRGDPGFFSFIGKAFKGLAGSVLGLGGGGSKLALPAGYEITKAVPKVLARPGVQRVLKAGRRALPYALPAAGAAAAAYGAGRLLRPGERRRRRMNVCNPRALRRSIRRTQGFAKLAMRTIHLVHPRKKVRFGGFRKRRKRAA